MNIKKTDMEEKINKAAILKDKPKGTKLYTILSDSECFLNEASEDSIYIDIDNRERFWCLSAYGSTYSFPNGCVLLFPSKEMRDWSKFAWKKGDVLVSNDGGTEVVFDKWYDETYTSFYCKHYLNSEDENKIVYLETFLCTTERYSLEDKDSVQTYINTIEERLGGKLNGETLVVEKTQPEFKDGDILYATDRISGIIYINKKPQKNIDICYCYKSIGGSNLHICNLENSYDCTLPSNTIIESKTRFATKEEKLELFKALAKENKAWDSDKKQIVDLKPNVELKPFDKVLVRDSESDNWRANLFGYIDKDEYYHCVYANWVYCIPYAGNEHLLGTTNNVEG